MPNNAAEILAAWMEGHLTTSQREQFEHLMANDPDFSKRVETSHFLSMQAQDINPLDVPEWNKEDAFPIFKQRRWWQWEGFPALSTVLSVVAVMLVLLKVEFAFENEGLMISFAGKGRQQEIERTVAERLKQFEQQQAAYLLDNLAQIRQDQQIANASISQYVINTSREERRDEFAEFIQFINQQRSDDQLFYTRQINRLEAQLYPAALELNE